ncbi:MAG TPA: hypothetical protein VLL52_24335 [Anaerolineae bacterium]|nr:hypothetical protein [Anaerolineae bacterium]
MQTDNKIWIRVAGLAIMIVAIAIAIGWVILNGDRRLLRNVSVGATAITPNADGVDDIVRIAYEITRNANVSIYFENEAGERYYFRREQPRGVNEYEVLFSGVVEPYQLPDEQIQGEILARLLQDGQYEWVIEAVDDSGVRAEERGSLLISEADTSLPELRDYGFDRALFTPNRDGIDDRLLIQFYQTKEARVRVYLIGEGGLEYPISELERDIPRGAAGRHYYDYEGGVDNGAQPPADGVYEIVAESADDEGQKMRVSDTVEIRYGGVPRADIFAPATGDTLQLSGTAIELCNTLYFTVTVENYGNTPIRTTGPEPGTVYDSDWNYNTVGWSTASGAWRVGIGYENELSNYPYRWAVGELDDLEEIDGYYYLMPGERAVVTGGIRLVGPFGERNPQPLWAGLIHEDVEIAQFNNRVDPQAILVDMADEANRESCEPRPIPERDEQ